MATLAFLISIATTTPPSLPASEYRCSAPRGLKSDATATVRVCEKVKR